MGAVFKVAVAVVLASVAIKMGIGLLRGLGRPLPDPPPPGELRKVAVRYRCSVCGMEIKATLANDEQPSAPRHCMEEMDVLLPVD